MSDNLEELGKVKASMKSQEFSWKQRMWAIPKLNDNSTWVDKKGNYHLHVNVNEADGIIRLLEPQKLIPIDRCSNCKGRISIDAKNNWDLNKRKTITSLFGTDTTFTILLIVMGIIALGAMGFAFYLYGQNNTLSSQLQLANNKLQSDNVVHAPPTAKLILGVIH